MKTYLLLILFLSLSFWMKAQQDPLFTHFWNSKQVYNPGFTGLDYRYNAEAIARTQWVGVNGAPNSQLITYGMRLQKYNSGLGLTYLHETIGFNIQHQAKLNYAYRLKIGDAHHLSLGISAGINNVTVTPDWVPPTTGTDPNLPSSFSQTEIIGDFGAVYKNNRFISGLSITQITNTSASKNYQSAKHYYLHASYTFGKFEKLQIRPQILIRTDLVKMSADINSLFIYKNRYTLGLTYRTSDAVCFLAGYTVRNKFTLSYSYDLTINKLSSISQGSHEIHLGFILE